MGGGGQQSGGENGDNGHMMQCEDDVSLSLTLETGMVL